MNVDELTKLAAALRSAGLDLTAGEVADAIWLASQQQPIRTAKRPKPPPDRPAEPQQPRERPSESVVSPTKESEPAPRLPQAGPQFPGWTVTLPAASALPHRLDLARGLRPLMRRVPSRTLFVLDGEATVTRIAEEEVWEPVLHPALVRRFDLMLVVEASESMAVWGPTIREWRRRLEVQGAFHDVRAWTLHTDAQREPRLTPELASSSSVGDEGIRPRALSLPSTERLIVLVSDGLSRAWKTGAIFQVLHGWGNQHPTAIVSPLPPRLWSNTALGQPLVTFCALAPGVPNVHLVLESSGRLVEKGRIAVPVAALDSHSLHRWAKLTAAAGGGRAPGIILSVPPPLSPEPAPRPTEYQPTPLERVQLFRAVASKPARKLAGYLAAVRLTLPVMRWVQQRMLSDSGQLHLAEVFLSGFLTRVSPPDPAIPPDQIEYDFHDGVRQVLLRDVPMRETMHLLDLLQRELRVRLPTRRVVRDPTTTHRGSLRSFLR